MSETNDTPMNEYDDDFEFRPASQRRGKHEDSQKSSRGDRNRGERRYDDDSRGERDYRKDRRQGYRDYQRGYRDDEGRYRDNRRGGYRDDRGYREDRRGGYRDEYRGDRSGRRWEDRNDRGYRGGRRDSYRDDRRGGYRDDWDYREDRRGGYRDEYRGDRSGRRWEDRDDRGYRDGRRNSYRDDRRDSYRDDRGYRDDRRGGYREDRRGGYRDEYRDGRSGRRWEDRDDRGYRDGRRNSYRDDRRDSYRDDRGYRDDRRGGYRDDRRDSGRGYRDDRRGYQDRERGRREEERGYSKRFEREPEVPEFVSAGDLDPEARAHLRSLGKERANRVARHLVYAGSMMDENPQLAYEHAAAAYRIAPRIDVVREALGLTAYLTGRYSEALRELRTYRRMTDDYTHVAVEADSERGLGRAEKALRFIDEVPLSKLDPEARIELALVKSGARADTGDYQGGLDVLEKINVDNLDTFLQARVELIRSDRFDELGREEEAQALREKWEPIFAEDGEVDLYEEEVEEAEAMPASDEGNGEYGVATEGSDDLAGLQASGDWPEGEDIELDASGAGSADGDTTSAASTVIDGVDEESTGGAAQ